MIAATVALATLAYITYRSSTPGTGEVLVSIILGMLALFALMSVPKLDWQDEQAATYRGILDDMRTRFPLTVRFTSGSAQPPDAAGKSAFEGVAETGAPVSIHFAEPEVNRVDAKVVDEAKHMAAEGAPIDDICRMIDPEHDRHDPMHQEAFRRIVQAMIEHG